MTTRRTRLVDCSPQWVNWSSMDMTDGVRFDCPEGHPDCVHVIPFTPAIDGSLPKMDHGRGWQRTGDTFDTLTLSPSIRRNPTYANREAALAAGALEEYLTPSMFCALHIFIRDGQIEFCGDSR